MNRGEFQFSSKALHLEMGEYYLCIHAEGQPHLLSAIHQHILDTYPMQGDYVEQINTRYNNPYSANESRTIIDFGYSIAGGQFSCDRSKHREVVNSVLDVLEANGVDGAEIAAARNHSECLQQPRIVFKAII